MSYLKISREVNKYKSCKQAILDFFRKETINPQTISLYCGTTGVPIIPTYYFIITELNKKELLPEMERLCKFYNMELDLEI